MSELFLNGWVVDLALALMLLEAAGLAVFAAKGHRVALLANVAAGACLMLALRGALTGAAWPWIALGLVGALTGHVTDVAHRLRFLCSNRAEAAGRSVHPR